MDALNEAKKLINEAKNISVVSPETNGGEAVLCALSLFYTLRELNKNVNLLIEEFPEKFSFLIPSPDFISQPKNLVISIPSAAADVSQVYYEKNADGLKIHLAVDKGNIKKDNVSFYFSEPKPDLVITLGIKNFRRHLESKMDAFGYLLGSSILNIDTLPQATGGEENQKFGAVNLLENRSLSEIAIDIIKSMDENLIKGSSASCLLAGMVVFYENFGNAATSSSTLKTASYLMEKGANYNQITENIQKTTPRQMEFLSEVFKNMNNENGVFVSELKFDEFIGFGRREAEMAAEKINGLGLQNDLLVLWKSHASEPMIKGFFYSKKTHLINKVSEIQNENPRGNWVFISVAGENIDLAKEQILKTIL